MKDGRDKRDVRKRNPARDRTDCRDRRGRKDRRDGTGRRYVRDSRERRHTKDGRAKGGGGDMEMAETEEMYETGEVVQKESWLRHK